MGLSTFDQATQCLEFVQTELVDVRMPFDILRADSVEILPDQINHNKKEITMKTVKHLLQEKGHTVVTIDSEDSVLSAMQRMAANNIGALLVMSGGQLVGIFTERDFSRKAYLLDKPVKDTLVKEIMTRKVFYVRLSDTNEDCMALITEMRVRHLPVIDDDKVVGLLSIGDLVKDAISQCQFVIHQLERYIYDTPGKI